MGGNKGGLWKEIGRLIVVSSSLLVGKKQQNSPINPENITAFTGPLATQITTE